MDTGLPRRVTDREYYDVLRIRALDIVRDMERELSTHGIKSSDGRMAPHVTAERLVKVANMAEALVLLRQVVK